MADEFKPPPLESEEPAFKPPPVSAEVKPGLMEQARQFTQEHPKITAATSMIPGFGPVIGGLTDPANETGKGMAKQLGRDAYGIATSPAVGPIGLGAKYLGEKSGLSGKVQQATEPRNAQQEFGGNAATAAEMTLPLPKAVEALPSKARAGEDFERAMAAARNEPVDVSKFAKPVLRAQQLNARTGDTMPAIMRKALGAIGPTTEPLTYEAARDMASAAGRKSVQQSMAPRVASPPMNAQGAGLAKGLDQATAEAAERAGVGDVHNRAMRQYRNASRLEDVGSKLKKAGIAAATGAGLYEVGKPYIRDILGGGR